METIGINILQMPFSLRTGEWTKKYNSGIAFFCIKPLYLHSVLFIFEL